MWFPSAQRYKWHNDTTVTCQNRAWGHNVCLTNNLIVRVKKTDADK